MCKRETEDFVGCAYDCSLGKASFQKALYKSAKKYLYM